jgi:sterol 14-demethylase
MFSLSDFQGYPTAVIASTTIVILSIGAYILLGGPQYRFSPNSPKRITEGYPILGAFRFFTARWDFFRHARAQTPSGNFSFFLGKHPIVGMSGDKGRQLFFESRDLDFAEG